MALLSLLGLSAILFIATGAFCRSCGFFDSPQTYFLALGFYCLFWMAPTALAGACWLVYEMVA